MIAVSLVTLLYCTIEMKMNTRGRKLAANARYANACGRISSNFPLCFHSNWKQIKHILYRIWMELPYYIESDIFWCCNWIISIFVYRIGSDMVCGIWGGGLASHTLYINLCNNINTVVSCVEYKQHMLSLDTLQNTNFKVLRSFSYRSLNQ